jgi:putative acyl-CoA dehydrogenase
VTNQPPPLVDYDLFASDRALVDAIRKSEASWAQTALHDIGRRAGSAEAIDWGFDANRYAPVLRTHDRFGQRLDEVEYHPSYHRLMEVAVGAGFHSSSWRDPKPGAHLARAAGFYLWSQVDAGHGCPISMTHAVVPALRMQPELAALWEPLVFASTYEPRLRVATEKGSALFGMAMTEKQGGSDVRANTTRAEPAGARGPGREYRLTGHKWFCSAPMCDAFLVLAQAPAGLSCFLLPRVLPDGRRNAFLIQRLKDKLGNRSNASCEVEFDGTQAWLVGEEGRGVAVIVEMVNCTRVDCVIGSAAGMRQALAQAIHHMRHRRAFGTLLVEQPLASNVLADLALESEAALVIAVRLSEASDRRLHDAGEAALRRIGTAVAKYWVCKRAAPHAAEALECLGGNGYVEESIMPRLVRESPLNSLWEGAGNVNALDVLRAAGKESGALDSFFAEVEQARGADRRLDGAIDSLRSELADASEPEFRARRLVERMALILQGALVVRRSPAFVADAFCASRLGGDWGHAFGTLPRGCDTTAIVARAFEL